MKKTLYLECNSGISGDMTVGALLDLGADRKVLEDALASLGVDGYHLHFGTTEKCGIKAYDFDVHLEYEEHEHDHGDYDHGHDHAHAHVHEDGTEYSHEHCHDHEHEHTHEHSHEECTEHVHDHEHTHTHTNEDGTEHAHEHCHDHGHTHDHGDHDHVHTHDHGDHDHVHTHDHMHPHTHRNLYDIYTIIDRLQSSDKVKQLARRIFEIVAEAESKAHGLPIDQVHFHEVGAIDSIVDIISTAVCLDNLGIEKVIVSPLAEGQGYVRCQHGTLPVPVPATANIAQAYGLKLRFTETPGEMVTPTGAAIAAALGTGASMPKNYRIVKIGIGAGNKDFDHANILRAMIIEEEEEEKTDSLELLETNLDDCTGEVLGSTMNLLLKAGANDVWFTPIYMKKNRPAYMLSVLCRESSRETMEDIIFTHTTSIGIRRFPAQRTALDRRKIQVETVYGAADVKVCSYKGKQYCYPEYDSVSAICDKQGNVDFNTVYEAVEKAAKELI